MEKLKAFLSKEFSRITNASQLPARRKSVFPETHSRAKEQPVALRSFSGEKQLRKLPVEFSAEERALRDEKVLFIRMTFESKNANHLTWESAANLIAGQQAHLFPRLAKEGRLRHNNVRNWRKILGTTLDGAPNYANADLLLRNYGHEAERHGDPAFWRALMSRHLNVQRLKLTKNYDELKRAWMLQYPDRPLPTLAQVRYYISQQYPPRMLALARQGENYYDQHYRDSIARDPDSIRPNECWVADTLECDFFIRVADENGKWSAIRPWLCTILDIKSEFIVSVQLGVGSTTNAVIRNALALGISQYGRPMKFLTDNGADYKKMGFTTPIIFTPSVTNSECYSHCILKELDIEHRLATPYNGRSKFVERFFRELNEYSRSARGYVGNKPENRPATADVWAKPENCEYLMNAYEACEFIDRIIRQYHQKSAPESKYLRGLSPEQAFASELRIQRNQMSMDEYYRAFLLPMSGTRKVDPRGPSVTCGKIRYVAIPEQRQKLWKYDSKDVMLKFDMLSPKHCHVFDLDGTYICECRSVNYHPYFVETEAERTALKDQLSVIRAERKELLTMIRHETGGFHRLDPASVYQLDATQLETGARIRKLDSKHSVKGETHNPAIYVEASELAAPIPAKVFPETQKRKRNQQLEQDVEKVLLADTQPETPFALPDETIKTTEEKQPQGALINENFI